MEGSMGRGRSDQELLDLIREGSVRAYDILCTRQHNDRVERARLRAKIVDLRGRRRHLLAESRRKETIAALNWDSRQAYEMLLALRGRMRARAKMLVDAQRHLAWRRAYL